MASPSLAVNGRPENRLLARLPQDEWQCLGRHLKTVPLEPRQVLHRQGDHLRQVYFPNGGVVSMVSVLTDGAMVEAATIGDEGIVGVEAAFGSDETSACETIVQVAGPHETAEMLAVEHFRHALSAYPEFARAVNRYMRVLYAVLARLTACNTRHDVRKRCARWLLMTHDRMHHQDFHLSHEFLAVMLGVRRPTVSVVAGTLQSAGLIQYSQGDIKIVDRHGLKDASCECYSAIRALLDSLQA